MRARPLTLAAFALITSSACGDSSTEPEVGPPTQIVVVAGASQTGVFRQPTAIVPKVLVTDAQNRPVPGVTVSFTLSAGAGTLGANTASTDANGNATPGAWTLGSTFGEKVLTATVTGLPPVTFNASAIAPDAGILAFNLTDPANDTTGQGAAGMPKAHDLLSFRGDFKRDSLILTLTFAGPVMPTNSGDPLAITGSVEFDIDDSAATGASPFANLFGGTANLGVEYLIAVGTSPATMFSATGSRTVPSSLSGSTIVVRIPMQMLGNDDGNFGMVGVIGTPDRPTDLFPNTGSTAVRPTEGVALRIRPLQGVTSVIQQPAADWRDMTYRR